jgi:cell division protein FtsA
VERIIVGIDVGTTKICTLVGEVDEAGVLRVVGVGTTPARGIRKGVVVNVAEATDAIAASIEKAERISGYAIESAYVGLAGAHISAINSRGVVAVNRGERGIQPADIERALDAARAVAIPHNREILHVIPRAYTVDDDDGVRDPLGMQAYRLEVESHIITGATASAVLTDVEREMGVVLADIGGGTTDIAIFIEGSIWHTVVLPTGGEHITNDIGVGLRTPFTTAEELKIKHGHARPDSVNPNETIDVAMFGEGDRQRVSRQFLSQIIGARVEEIFDMVLQEIKRSGYDGLLPAGVVLCGGTADLAGIRDLARDMFKLPVRIGAPQDLHGLVDILGSPAYATSVGLLRWGIQHDVPQPSRAQRNGHFKLPGFIKAFLPERQTNG